MDLKEWEKRNEDYVAEIAGDDDLSDRGYIEVLSDLVERAESAISAKLEETATDE